jgi:hypothetical protein
MPDPIDLEPQEYRQIDGPKRREPFLAPGWYWALLALAFVLGVKGLIYFSIISIW